MCGMESLLHFIKSQKLMTLATCFENEVWTANMYSLAQIK